MSGPLRKINMLKFLLGCEVMFGTLAASMKLKAIIATVVLLLSDIGLHEIAGDGTEASQPTHTYDPYTMDIQKGSDLIYNTVSEVIIQQGKQSPIAYKQTCESSLGFIQGERLDTDHNYNTLDTDQKELIQDYRTYLKESASVVSSYRSGGNPDLTAMKTAKAALY